MATPKKRILLTVIVPEELLRDAKNAAKRRDLTLSQVVRRGLKQFLAAAATDGAVDAAAASR